MTVFSQGILETLSEMTEKIIQMQVSQKGEFNSPSLKKRLEGMKAKHRRLWKLIIRCPQDQLKLLKKKLTGDEERINEEDDFDAIFAELHLHCNEPDSQQPDQRRKPTRRSMNKRKPPPSHHSLPLPPQTTMMIKRIRNQQQMNLKENSQKSSYLILLNIMTAQKQQKQHWRGREFVSKDQILSRSAYQI
jgi:hypothetical protein